MKKSLEIKGTGRIVRRQNLPLMLLQAREMLLLHFRPIFNRFGLTEQQWRILRVVSDHEPIEQHEVSALCQISGPSLSNILVNLEEAGYVSRARSREDQRKVYVELSKRGRTLVREVAPDVDARYRELEQMLGKEMISSLSTLLDRLMSLPMKAESQASGGGRKPGNRVRAGAVAGVKGGRGEV